MTETVELGRKTIEVTLCIGAPVLLIALVVSLLVNIGQVLTSLQEPTLSSVPRLAVTAVAVIVLMPWMFNRLSTFTVRLLGDFRPWLR